MPYEESIRVPLVVVVPTVEPCEEWNLVAVDLDVPATILELAGIDRPSDGKSLRNLLSNPANGARDSILFESWGYRSGAFGVWASLRTKTFKFTEYPTGELELYEIKNDPFELEGSSKIPSSSRSLMTIKQYSTHKTGLR
jgi:arylsulfatase A-like enzyme